LQSKFKLFFLIIILIGIICFIFDDENLIQTTFKYIPNDSSLLIKLSSINTIYSNDIFTNYIKIEINDKLKNINIPKKIRNFLSEPNTFGLDMNKEVFVFKKIDSKSPDISILSSLTGIVLPIENYDLLSKNVVSYFDYIPDNNLEMINGTYDKFDYILFKNRYEDNKDLALFTYNQDVVIIYLNNFIFSLNLLNQMKDSLEDSYVLHLPENDFSKSNQLSMFFNLKNISINHIDFIDNKYNYLQKYFSNAFINVNYQNHNLKISANLEYKINDLLKFFLFKINKNNTLYFRKTFFDLKTIFNENKINFLKIDNQILELKHKLNLYKYVVTVDEEIYFKEENLLDLLNKTIKDLF
tara:strand:- start:1706 stop:2770 length:1065 start_codon:yes stop_codon:yes gene_type:complete